MYFLVVYGDLIGYKSDTIVSYRGFVCTKRGGNIKQVVLACEVINGMSNVRMHLATYNVQTIIAQVKGYHINDNITMISFVNPS